MSRNGHTRAWKPRGVKLAQERNAQRLLADAQRRQDRMTAEHGAFENSPHVAYTRDPLGVPSNNMRMVRATEDCWETTVTRDRMFQAIAQSSNPLDYTTVAVTRPDGTSARVAAGAYRQERETRATRKRAAADAAAPETAGATVDFDTRHAERYS